jgi:hypothetical protein
MARRDPLLPVANVSKRENALTAQSRGAEILQLCFNQRIGRFELLHSRQTPNVLIRDGTGVNGVGTTYQQHWRLNARQVGGRPERLLP